MSKQSGWNTFVSFWKWIYDNITIVVCIMLLVDFIIFLRVDKGLVFAILNLAILAIFGLRIWMEYRSNKGW